MAKGAKAESKPKDSAQKQNAAPKQTAVLKGNPCPVCGKKTLTLTESETEVPYFGKIYLFSMICESCNYHKSDVEVAIQHEPAKYTFEISKPEDMKVRVIKSSEATVKIPYIGDISPGASSEGYITNIEGILQRIKEQVEHLVESEEEDDAKKKAKNLLKKLQKIMLGWEKSKIIIEDPTGNSAIVSEKAAKSKM